MNNALLGNRGIISAHCVCTWKTESFASRSVPKRLLFCNRTSQVPTCPEMDRKLYGPSRLSAQTHIADLLARDSVLQKGEWQDGAANRHSWQTTFSNFFRVSGVGFSDPGRERRSRRESAEVCVDSYRRPNLFARALHAISNQWPINSSVYSLKFSC